MLHYETVDAATLALLKNLQSIPDFSRMRLVGGTSYALQTGHRKSVDLDFFGNILFEEENILPQLKQLGPVTILKKSQNINICLINGIKTDFVNYTYKWLERPYSEDGLVLARPKDIAAMKLAAITGRGTKKDFIDLFFLLKTFSLQEMLDFYKEKYPDASLFLVLKSLSYFLDAEENEMPVLLMNVEWETVKSTISDAVKTITPK